MIHTPCSQLSIFFERFDEIINDTNGLVKPIVKEISNNIQFALPTKDSG